VPTYTIVQAPSHLGLRAPGVERLPEALLAAGLAERLGAFLLGDAEESGRDAVLCLQGNRLQAIKWRQWKLHLFLQDDIFSTFSPYSSPHLHNLESDPREEHQVGFPHGWAVHPMAAAAAAFLKSLATEPPIKPGTPDPYTPPQPGELRAEEHLQIGPITQYVTSLTRSHDQLPDPHHGLEHSGG
jgi:arylsulfatase